jgi:hypothetical protein
MNCGDQFIQERWEMNQFARLAAIVAALVVIATNGVYGTDALGAQNPRAELAKLFNSQTHPLPLVPVIVPPVINQQQVDDLLTPGNNPTMFQISRGYEPSDPDFLKVLFFQEMAIEYPNVVNFRKVGADSAAAKRLYHAVTRPVYIIANPNKTGPDRLLVIDESDLRWDQVVDQVMLEGLIKQELGLSPTLFSPLALTAENMQKVIYEYTPEFPNPGRTARVVAMLFYSPDAKQQGPVNRLRVLLGLERFFYARVLRFAEVDVSTQPGPIPFWLCW